ncbi:glycosyltransferase family 2 protein [Pseudoalteromonas sp. MMG005]|nr:glycosyltransferase family 2 protein [Pseudoalteromonas sp. MMG005]
MMDIIIPATNKPELEKTLLHLTSLGERIGNVIVVDFDKETPSLPEHKIEMLRKLVDIKYIFVNGLEYFNKSIAINVGFDFVSSEYILLCDADVLLDKSFFTISKCYWQALDAKPAVFSPQYVVESDNGQMRKGPGICFLKYEHFKAIEGYSADFTGWGMEDVDFLQRLEYVGVEKKLISHAIHLSHSDDARTRNYHSKSVQEMRLKNRALYKIKHEKKQIYGSLRHDISCISREEA